MNKMTEISSTIISLKDIISKLEDQIVVKKPRRSPLKEYIQKEFGDVEITKMAYTKQRLLLIMRTHNIRAYCEFMCKYNHKWTGNRAHRRAMVEQYLVKNFCSCHGLTFVKRNPPDKYHLHNEGKHKGYYVKQYK